MTLNRSSGRHPVTYTVGPCARGLVGVARFGRQEPHGRAGMEAQVARSRDHRPAEPTRFLVMTKDAADRTVSTDDDGAL